MSKTKDNYFDNKMVEELIVNYQKNECIKEKNKLKEIIMIHVNEIIKRIISCYDFARFEEREDLLQHAAEACFKSIKNFNPFHPKYSSAFNWFSLTAKRSLLNYTLRKKKHRGHQDIDEHCYIEFSNKEINTRFIEDDFQKELFFIIDNNFLSIQRNNYIKITMILTNYLIKTRKFKKTDFYAWARSHGFTNAICRQYLKDISKHFNKIIIDIIEE